MPKKFSPGRLLSMSRSYAVISHKDNWRTHLKINYDIIDLKITGKPVKPVKLAKNSM